MKITDIVDSIIEKVNIATGHITSSSNPHSVNKTQVGLSNVDNTSDVDKPISTATQTALNTKIDKVTSTDNAIVRFDGTTGQVQNSGVVISDSGNVTIPAPASGVALSVTPFSGQNAISASGQIAGTVLQSTVANGTAPIAVTSTTKVANLNADYLDGYSATNANTANTIVQRDASGNFSAGTITATLSGNISGSSSSCTGNASTAYGLNVHTGRNNEANKVVRTDGNGYATFGWINTTSGDTSTTSTTNYFVETGSDGYIRKKTKANVITDLGISSKANTNQTMYIGTTAVAINRGSAAITLAGTSISGNATTATTLQTARTINGVSFNGSANITVYDSTKASLASPAFTGTPTAPTATTGTNTTQLATTAYANAIAGGTTTPAVSKANNGYMKMANGIIVQWGRGSYPNATWLLTSFPLAFPTGCLTVNIIIENSNATYASVLNPNSLPSKTGFSHFTYTNPTGLYFRWIAIGY